MATLPAEKSRPHGIAGGSWVSDLESQAICPDSCPPVGEEADVELEQEKVQAEAEVQAEADIEAEMASEGHELFDDGPRRSDYTSTTAYYIQGHNKYPPPRIERRRAEVSF